jgi:hypothetical protein
MEPGKKLCKRLLHSPISLPKLAPLDAAPVPVRDPFHGRKARKVAEILRPRCRASFGTACFQARFVS